jgi:anaerobic magnesium-protoporphyrin IX monomethyl ester cyclase
VSWVCNSRVDTVSPQLLRAIKRAGCWMIGYGIESGNQGVLDSVKKGTTLADAVSAVRMAHEVGLEVTGHCILGFPGESVKTMQETIDFAKFLRLDYAQFYCAVAFPGSVMYKQAVKSGWLDTDDWRYFEQNFSVISTNGLKSADIMAARDKAYKEFYRQPYLFWNVIKKVNGPGDVANFARMFRDFLAWV